MMTQHHQEQTATHLAHRLSVAPMMDWTDRHCRVFHRMLAPDAMLYSEMVTADAIIHGDRERLLKGHHTEMGDPVTLQLGGSEPAKLADAIALATPYQYAEYNLNVGCPSDRVQSGRFGACLMAEPKLVRDCMAAIIKAADVPASVKCRIGIDDMDPEKGLDDFVKTVADAGVEHFIIHARKAWLNGLSPKENRSIPPLDYGRVARLQDAYPSLNFSINGGIAEVEQAADMASNFHGVMIGRAAYQTPYLLAQISSRIFGHDVPDRMDIALKMADYADIQRAEGTRLIAITRHMLGLMNGLPGARAWRRSLSEDARGDDANPNVIRDATATLQETITATKAAA